MQIHITETPTIEMQIIEDDALFFTPKKKTTRSRRKWREIEELKAQQQLNKELREIDQSFAYTLPDLT